MKRRNSFYGFLKMIVTIGLRLFYRKLEVHGYEQVPKDVPLIFTSNHQGTLMDAVLIICSSKLHIASLTRADIFKKPWVKRLLNAMMMIPIYRPRDSVNIREKNDEVFRDCFAFFQKKGAIIIFPEGSNGLAWHLRSFKKGVARLAFGAEANNQFNLNLHVVPVGIHYSKHTGFRSDIIVNYGKPIKVANYKTVYEQSAAKGIKQLMEAIRSGIQEKMLHFPSIENYKAQVMALRILHNEAILQKKIPPLQQLKTKQKYVSRLDALKQHDLSGYNNLIEQLNRYCHLLKQHHLKDKTLIQHKSIGVLLAQFIGLVLLSPLWFFAVVNCGLAYLLNRFFIKKLGLTIYFLGSIKFVLGLFVSGLLFLLQAFLVGCLFKSGVVGLLYFISLPLLGIFWYHYNVAVIKFMSSVKKNRLMKSSKLDEIMQLRKTILDKLDFR